LFYFVFCKQQVVDSSGVAKVVLRILAQHHCSPPPSPTVMAAWLNALRKRHAKQYNSMQTALQEMQYFQERKDGYRDSVQNDVQRQVQEAKGQAERLAKEKEEQERKDAMGKRREELKTALPEEDTTRAAKTIAIRLADGRNGKRRFAPDTPLTTVFNWVDAMYEIEREKLILTTMNGKQTFSWEDDADKMQKTLEEAGLGRNTGFRVAEKIPEGVAESKDEEAGKNSLSI
jgi:Skp family chaperone for outer membrane proteins